MHLFAKILIIENTDGNQLIKISIWRRNVVKGEGRKSPDVRLQGLEYGYHAKTVIGNF